MICSILVLFWRGEWGKGCISFRLTKSVYGLSNFYFSVFPIRFRFQPAATQDRASPTLPTMKSKKKKKKRRRNAFAALVDSHIGEGEE